jgi:hypothetical protein
MCHTHTVTHTHTRTHDYFLFTEATRCGKVYPQFSWSLLGVCRLTDIEYVE